MLTVQLIVKPAERGVLLGVFLFTYWIAASLLATALGDTDMSTEDKLMFTAPIYLSAASILFVAGFYLPKYTIGNPESEALLGSSNYISHSKSENEALITKDGAS